MAHPRAAVRWPWRGRHLIPILLALACVTSLVTSCRPSARGPLGPAGGGPSILTSNGVAAVGPFLDISYARWEGDHVMGWGALVEGRPFLFSFGLDGSLATSGDLPRDFNPETPLPDGSGWVGATWRASGEAWVGDTVWFAPLDGKPRKLGQAGYGLTLNGSWVVSPSGARLLYFGAGGAVSYETDSWRGTHQPGLPSLDLSGPRPVGLGVVWVGDDLVVLRFWEYAGLAGQPDPGLAPLGLESRELDPHTGFLRLVKQPGGAVALELRSPGHILSPFPAPGGRWLAVLHIPGETAIIPPFDPADAAPLDAGREIRVYGREDLGNAEPVPVAIIRAGEGRMLHHLAWSPDGSGLVFSESAVSQPTADSPFPYVYVEYGRDCTTYEAAAPDFVPRSIPVRGWGLRAPTVMWSPGGRYLLIEDDVSDASLVWDRWSDSVVPIPPGLGLNRRWVGGDLLAAEPSGPGSGDWRCVVADLTTGEVTEAPWSGAQRWRPSPSGRSVAAVYGPGRGVGPFGALAEGYWLVVYPVGEGVQ